MTKMTKDQLAVLNRLKDKLRDQFEFIRYVRREGNAVKFYAGTFRAELKPGEVGFTKQQQARGWFPLGVEQDLTKYKEFIDALAIPGLTTEIVWKCPYITPEPEIHAVLSI